MNYFSLNHNAPDVSFEQAIVKGLAPDRGLYFPKEITSLPDSFFEAIGSKSNVDIAFETISPFIGSEIPQDELRRIVIETLNFGFPLVEVEKDTYSLELFHGPTLAFKDVGARFMARCLGYFNRNGSDQKNTVLVATSGDTGGAVASGFLDVEGVEVVILYPSGKVSDVQERQLTTLGKNISALKVDGSFDDCQAMVKRAFTDESLSDIRLTSANSINIARWLPQMWYFFFAYRDLKKSGKPIIASCPSGNFGNIAAGILAKKMGLPIDRFVASTNVNDTVLRFLEDWNYDPHTTIPTLSNAMDVSDPSNFVRIREMYGNDKTAFAAEFSSYSFSDGETLEAMKAIFSESNYVADPHGAVGYLGLKKELDRFPQSIGVFLETAHPCKFTDTVEKALGFAPEIPESVSHILKLDKKYHEISDYSGLHEFLTNS
ncbi:threonine synthase [Flavobacterium silvaticum]|uniref:Threonine synthase n=1 Tax=Flavobacterium silvaticum TaxID=1852020 RepID=A0A972FR22_9FLAO|nr:threonine synthase [Flavobacterium silvaticum]NMH26918.1 threonine synthase [Flavobacterium silvaticum]